MPRFIENLKTLTMLRARAAKDDAAVRIGDMGAIFLWDGASIAVDDGVDVVRPTSIASNLPGRWVNDSKAPRYYNKTAKFNLPIKEMFDTFTGLTSNPVVINISHLGLTEKPKWVDVKAIENQRQNMDYAEVFVLDNLTTKDQLVVELSRPPASIALGGVLNVKVGNNVNALSGITLYVRLIGV